MVDKLTDLNTKAADAEAAVSSLIDTKTKAA